MPHIVRKLYRRIKRDLFMALMARPSLVAGGFNVTAALIPWQPALAGMHARWLMHNGQTVAALKRIESLDKAGSDRCSLVRASVYYKLKRFEDAQAEWESVTARSPAHVDAWIGRGRVLHNEDKREQIDGLIQEFLKENERSSCRYLGASKIAAALWRPCFDNLVQQASEEAGDNPEDLLALAKLYRKTGRIGFAFPLLKRVRILDPDCNGLLTECDRNEEALVLCGLDPREPDAQELARVRLPDSLFGPLLALGPAECYDPSQTYMLVTTTLGPGGAERQIVNTIRGLRAAGRKEKIVVAQLKNDNPDVDEFYSRLLADQGVVSVTVSKVATVGIVPNVSDSVRMREILNALPGSFQLEVERMLRVILDHRPRVVHAWNDHRSLAAGVAAVLAGTPKILLSGRSVAPPGTRVVPDFFKSAYVALSQVSRVQLINNSSCGAKTYEAWLGLAAGRVGVIYNGIDLAHLESSRDAVASSALRLQLGVADDAPLIGSLFRISSEKRPRLWLESVNALIKQCPTAHFVIAGDGPLRKGMEREAKEIGVDHRVHFLGLVKNVVPLYGAMDVILLTSSREGTSNTALEALALGLPVVSPAVGGMPEVIIDGVNGFIVDANPSPDEIADKLAHCLTDKHWLQTAKTEARKMIQRRFSIEAMSRETLVHYGDFVRENENSSVDLPL